MSEEAELVKVHFTLEEPEMGVGGESLWAAPVGGNLYELRNSPWHVRTVNWLDVVEAISEDENQWPEFVRVEKRSGHRTVHLYIFDESPDKREEILNRCHELGASYEGMNKKMYAFDFAPEVELDPAIEYFASLQSAKTAAWRLNEYE